MKISNNKATEMLIYQEQMRYTIEALQICLLKKLENKIFSKILLEMLIYQISISAAVRDGNLK